METWGLGGVKNETKIGRLIIDFASVRAGLIQKSIISPSWTDNNDITGVYWTGARHYWFFDNVALLLHSANNASQKLFENDTL